MKSSLSKRNTRETKEAECVKIISLHLGVLSRELSSDKTTSAAVSNNAELRDEPAISWPMELTTLRSFFSKQEIYRP